MVRASRVNALFLVVDLDVLGSSFNCDRDLTPLVTSSIIVGRFIKVILVESVCYRVPRIDRKSPGEIYLSWRGSEGSRQRGKWGKMIAEGTKFGRWKKNGQSCLESISMYYDG